jgi:exopolysaccharide biosynthesis protein
MIFSGTLPSWYTGSELSNVIFFTSGTQKVYDSMSYEASLNAGSNYDSINFGQWKTLSYSGVNLVLKYTHSGTYGPDLLGNYIFPVQPIGVLAY